MCPILPFTRNHLFIFHHKISWNFNAKFTKEIHLVEAHEISNLFFPLECLLGKIGKYEYDYAFSVHWWFLMDILYGGKTRENVFLIITNLSFLEFSRNNLTNTAMQSNSLHIITLHLMSAPYALLVSCLFLNLPLNRYAAGRYLRGPPTKQAGGDFETHTSHLLLQFSCVLNHGFTEYGR